MNKTTVLLIAGSAAVGLLMIETTDRKNMIAVISTLSAITAVASAFSELPA